MTSSELAAKTDTNERYIREWLLNQAAGDYIHEADWAGAAHILQLLLNSPEDLFVEIKRQEDGKEKSQWTSIRYEANRDAPEGLIDPMLRTLSFWDGDTPAITPEDSQKAADPDGGVSQIPRIARDA